MMRNRNRESSLLAEMEKIGLKEDQGGTLQRLEEPISSSEMPKI